MADAAQIGRQRVLALDLAMREERVKVAAGSAEGRPARWLQAEGRRRPRWRGRIRPLRQSNQRARRLVPRRMRRQCAGPAGETALAMAGLGRALGARNGLSGTELRLCDISRRRQQRCRCETGGEDCQRIGAGDPRADQRSPQAGEKGWPSPHQAQLPRRGGARQAASPPRGCHEAARGEMLLPHAPKREQPAPARRFFKRTHRLTNRTTLARLSASAGVTGWSRGFEQAACAASPNAKAPRPVSWTPLSRRTGMILTRPHPTQNLQRFMLDRCRR